MIISCTSIGSSGMLRDGPARLGCEAVKKRYVMPLSEARDIDKCLSNVTRPSNPFSFHISISLAFHLH